MSRSLFGDGSERLLDLDGNARDRARIEERELPRQNVLRLGQLGDALREPCEDSAALNVRERRKQTERAGHRGELGVRRSSHVSTSTRTPSPTVLAFL